MIEMQSRELGLQNLSHRMEQPTMWFPNRSDTIRAVHRSWLEAGNLGFRKQRNCTVRVAKTKALISFIVIISIGYDELVCSFDHLYIRSSTIGFSLCLEDAHWCRYII